MLNPVTRDQDPYPGYVGPFNAKLQPLPPDSNPNKIIVTYEKDFTTPNACTDPLLCRVDGTRRPCQYNQCGSVSQDLIVQIDCSGFAFNSAMVHDVEVTTEFVAPLSGL